MPSLYSFKKINTHDLTFVVCNSALLRFKRITYMMLERGGHLKPVAVVTEGTKRILVSLILFALCMAGFHVEPMYSGFLSHLCTDSLPSYRKRSANGFVNELCAFFL